jgi:hypothetical protein
MTGRRNHSFSSQAARDHGQSGIGSPSIVERLQKDGGLLAPSIPDWRAMVDCIMIDQAYDGKIFNIMLADVPERKQGYVQGTYSFDAPAIATAVAVKITDMLGEEVLFVKTV